MRIPELDQAVVPAACQQASVAAESERQDLIVMAAHDGDAPLRSDLPDVDFILPVRSANELAIRAKREREPVVLVTERAAPFARLDIPDVQGTVLRDLR